MNVFKKIFILCLIIYLIIIFGTEILYREKLYKISVSFEEKIKQSGFLHYFYFFWSYIFIYGGMLAGTIIVMILYPYNIFLCYITIELTLIFIMCFLKSIYTNSRPYWDIFKEKLNNNILNIKPTECDGGFGNQSGHALMSTSFLNLWYLLINSNYLKYYKRKWRIIIKFCSLLLVIICILSVIFSRIHRQIHSFNQILFGSLLGIGVFFYFCFIIEFDKIEPNIFFNILDKFKYVLIPLLLILFSISVALGYTIHNKNENEYEKVLMHYCKYIKEQIFGINTAFHSALILIIIGGYVGILFLKYNINKNYYNKEEMFYFWNKGPKIKTLKIIFFSFILPVIPLISIYIVPFKYFIIKFILEAILYFWYGFGAFGLCFYNGCILFNNEESETIHIIINPIQINV